MLIRLVGCLIILTILLDLILTLSHERIAPLKPYRSICLRCIKHFIMYGYKWDGIRITNLVDRIYNSALIILGMLAVGKLGKETTSYFLALVIPSFSIVILIETLKKIISGKKIRTKFIIVRSIYASYIGYILLGSIAFLYQNDYDGVRIILFLMILPICNSIYRKIYFRLNSEMAQ